MSDPANKTIYRNVLLGLLVGTVVTVGVSRVHLGTFGNIGIGLLVAVAKATLVILFFMHLKYEKKWWLSLVLFPIVLVAIIIFSNFPDTGLNSGKEEGQFLSPAVEKIEHRAKPGGAH
jgi:cytochrome c oxidase subunit 4